MIADKAVGPHLFGENRMPVEKSCGSRSPGRTRPRRRPPFISEGYERGHCDLRRFIGLGLKGLQKVMNYWSSPAPLGHDRIYRRLFQEAFPGESDPYDLPHVAKAIAAFERSFVPLRSPPHVFGSLGRVGGSVDHYAAGRKVAILRPAN